ncbi:MAG: M14 family metallopeptidase [Anaerolineae bacterium]|nr:M14 family metallopeptidase [Anaerolineae bacterium]MCO5193512.1 M14 family metallopeptidase [Anaerolineae bacterium]
MRQVIVILLLLVVLLLAACASDSAEVVPDNQTPSIAQPTQTVTSVPTATATQEPMPTATSTVTATVVPQPVAPTSEATLTPTPAAQEVIAEYKIVGFSAETHPIEAWQFGSGPNHLIFVGGIHGGYEWNTVLLGYELIDYLSANPQLIPPSVTLTIIPAANPDGVALVTGTRGRFTPDQVADETERGRFNADNVDINRNWDCDWQPTGQWGGNIVSGGSEPFSEAESYYLKEYFLAEQPRLVTFWHSKIPGVFLGQCDGVVIPDTRLFAEQYATASGYPLVEDGFTAYPVTGDASDYLNKVGIPSFTVELETRNSPETDRNLSGLLAILDNFR